MTGTAGTYYPGEAVRRTGDYQCLGSAPTGDLCPSVVPFTKAKGEKFTPCPERHGTVSPKWMGPVPLSETDSRRMIGGEWA